MKKRIRALWDRLLFKFDVALYQPETETRPPGPETDRTESEKPPDLLPDIIREQTARALTVQFQPAPDYANDAAELERLETLKAAYVTIDETIENELSALESELSDPNLSTKRETAIAKRKLILLKQQASNLARIQAIDRKIEMLYR